MIHSSNHPFRRAKAASAAASGAGYTLVEVLVSLMILTVGLVLVLESFQAASLALEKGRDHLAMSRTGSDIRQRCTAEVQLSQHIFHILCWCDTFDFLE